MSGSEDELLIMETEEKSELSGSELNFLKMLLIHVEGSPHLYNKKDRDYKNAAMKVKTWEQIGVFLKISGTEAAAKWKTLREKYAKERKKLRTKKSGSGTSEFSSPWPLYNHLSFLDPFIRERKICSYLQRKNDAGDKTLPATDELIDEGDEFGSDTEGLGSSSGSGSSPGPEGSSSSGNSPGPEGSSGLGSSTRKRKASDAGKSKEDPILKTIGEITEVMKLKVMNKNSESTEDDIFGRPIAAELKKIKNEKAKRVLKSKFYALLADIDYD